MTDNEYCENIPICEINNGNCEQICENSQSGSICSCFEGFESYNSTSTHCKDVDECIETNKCKQECLNTIGSFECKCSTGYFMNNNKQCEDINECNISSPCEFNCTNLIGGFECYCPDGFALSENNLTCERVKKQKACEAPTAFEHSILRCNEESSQCEISCEEGFILEGYALNMCLNGKWDHDFAKCIRKFLKTIFF